MDQRDENTLRLRASQAPGQDQPRTEVDRTIVLSGPELGLPEPGGLRIAGYEILRELGRGGMGIVYLAQDTALRRQVALKVLPGTLAASAEARIRFKREAETASRLNHPNLCGVYQVGSESGTDWLAMPFIEGRTLRDELQAAKEAGGRTTVESGHSSVFHATSGSWRGAVRLVEEIARALHAAHEAGIVHRDLKPGNVMVTPEGRPVVLDFGLAHDQGLGEGDAVTRPGDVLGTPYYMAPEQLQGRIELIGRGVDVWALGVMLFEVLALRRPFDGATREALFRQILEKDPPHLRRELRALPADLDTVIATALEKDLGRRYGTALALADDLKAVLEIRPIQARKTGLFGRGIRWVRRKPAQAALVLGAAVALPLLFTLVWSQRQKSERLRIELDARQGEVVRALSIGDTNRARQAWSDWIRLDPDQASVRELEARIAWQERRDDALALALDIEADPSGQLAQTALKAFPPTDAGVQWHRVAVSLRQGKPEEARQILAAAGPELGDPNLTSILESPTPETAPLAVAPGDPHQFTLLRALVASAQNRHREAFQLLVQELERNQNARDLAWIAANEARRLREWHAALAWAGRARPLGSEFRAERLARYSGHLRRAGQKDAAFAAAEKATALDPQSRIVRLEYANALGDMNQIDRADQGYRQLLEATPDWAEAWNAYGSWLWEIGRYEETVTACGRAVELDPSLLDAWHNHGSALAELQRFEEAKASIARVLAARPQHLEAMGAMAVIELGLGRPEQALEIQDQIVALNPRYAEAYVNRSNAKKKMGNREGAVADLRKALELSPGLTHAEHNLAILLMDSAPTEAESLLRSVVSKRDNDDDALANLALLVSGRGELEEALRYAKRAFEIDPEDAITCNTLGTVESELGHSKEAIAAFRRATTKAPIRIEPHANLMLLLQTEDPHTAFSHAVQLVHLAPEFEKKAEGNFLALKSAILAGPSDHVLAKALLAEGETSREDRREALVSLLREVAALTNGKPRDDAYSLKFAAGWLGRRLAQKSGDEDLAEQFKKLLQALVASG